jgi:hypothetical protein
MQLNKKHRSYLNLNNNQIKKCEAISNFNNRSAQIDLYKWCRQDSRVQNNNLSTILYQEITIPS